jgi:hypothetical protein
LMLFTMPLYEFCILVKLMFRILNSQNCLWIRNAKFIIFLIHQVYAAQPYRRFGKDSGSKKSIV